MHSYIVMPFFIVCILAIGLRATAAIEFKTVNLTHPNGTDYTLQNIVAMEFLPQSNSLQLLVATFGGTIYQLAVKHVSAYKYVCRELRSVTVPDGRSITAFTSDPFSSNVFFVTTYIPAYTQRGIPLSAWNNGQIFVLRYVESQLFYAGLELDSAALVMGLPVSNDTVVPKGPLGTAVAADGSLIITQPTHTNMGAPSPPNFQQDSFYSGTVLTADVRAPGKTLKIEWDSDDITVARPNNTDSSGIQVYATGFRTIYNLVVSTRGDLFATDNGGDPYLGPKSVSCDSSLPLNESQPDRLLRLRRGFWYGSANRVRGKEDPKFCVHLWGDESNLTDILNKYPDFKPPIMTTAQALADNILGSGSEGFIQYLPNWFPYLRKKFVGTEFDLTEARPGRPLPIMFAIDLWRKRIFKLADAPGLGMAVDPYGSIFVGQFTIGKIAIAVPVVKRWMTRVPKIRNVWPSRGKPGTEIWIVGTNMSKAAIHVGGKRCTITKRRKYLDVQLRACIAPTMDSYSKVASEVRVGKLSLEEAFTVLPPDVYLK